MNDPLEKALAVAFLVVGLSHIFQPRAWSDFFVDLFKTRAAALAIALYTLPWGLVLVFGHNRWEWGLSLIATLYGWSALIKGSLYLLYPQIAARTARGRIEKPASFVYAGLVVIALGATLAIPAFWGRA